MDMTLLPDRLIKIREERGLNKAEASRLLGLSKMGYLRYETAVRTPSYQTLVFIAQKLRTSPEYLAGLTDDPSPQELLVSRASDPELFDIYCKTGVGLALTGHAHGGQIRLPFIGPVFSPSEGLFPKYAEGMHTNQNTTMVVSRGLGQSQFPLRINNSPELVIVTLHNQ